MEVATETIMEYTKEVGGKHVPMWDKEEVDEIVIAQVKNKFIPIRSIVTNQNCESILMYLQSVLFLLAGFDTTATTLTNSIFLLAQNKEIQEKLYDQIVQKLDKFVSDI